MKSFKKLKKRWSTSLGVLDKPQQQSQVPDGVQRAACETLAVTAVNRQAAGEQDDSDELSVSPHMSHPEEKVQAATPLQPSSVPVQHREATATPFNAVPLPAANSEGNGVEHDAAAVTSSKLGSVAVPELPVGGKVPSTTLLPGGASPRSRLQYDPFVIAVAGGTASGKTTVCDLIIQRLHDQCVVIVNQDSFYKVLSEEESEQASLGQFNFDSPDAVDEGALLDCIDELRKGNAYDLPIYDFATHSRSRSAFRRVDPAQVIIVEGILALHFPSILERANMKVFVDSDDDVRLARRIKRDVAERGRDVAGVIQQYTRFVKPSHDEFIAPSRRTADIIVPWQRGDNLVAVDLIVGHLKSHIVSDVLVSQHRNLHLLPSTFQMRGMHTIIRDRETRKDHFMFYADRLIRMVVEYALGLLPVRDRAVMTPTHTPYAGKRIDASVCGVSIIRSGESMESALRSCWKGIDVGKILVHRRHRPSPAESPPGTGAHTPTARAPPPAANGPYYKSSHAGSHPDMRHLSVRGLDDLIYEKLPHDIADRHVLLMDPILGTGNTVARAIQVLLEKGVREERILYLTIIASRVGLKRVCSQFPAVKVITSEIDRDVDANFRVVPGVGEFGDRYFCS